jgi:hypothetical protein
MPRSLFGSLGRKGDTPKPPLAKPLAIPVRPTAIPVRPVATPVPITQGRKITDPAQNLLWYEGRGPYGTAEGVEQVLQPGSKYESAFLFGTVLNVTSSWLQWVVYHMDTSELEVHFVDGFSCRVQDVSQDEARDFFVAGSKGQWYHENVLGPNYVKGQPSTAIKRWL